MTRNTQYVTFITIGLALAVLGAAILFENNRQEKEATTLRSSVEQIHARQSVVSPGPSIEKSSSAASISASSATPTATGQSREDNSSSTPLEKLAKKGLDVVGDETALRRSSPSTIQSDTEPIKKLA